ncbi:hypothetical protein [Mucilaginibacter myungsuensis]|uniref:Uncharacterized protein n=1 Tax=Mucilaginibacter myungsuensis TaxID=649104 RepID=A0A929KZ43_9SPHI|nr:hypothetical protein [Mucilaginibacter myungsuensis]MBE9663118.1 hypothetical protein [Mucilaginibacter myungsuensis]MDN3598753.1 hypothetical protein [Mucilaginibacter myungsuensis]
MMTLDEFNTLSPEEKTSVAVNGNFIDVRLEKGLKVALYSHPDFYAEVFYDGDNNRITRCRAFTALSSLAAYVKLGQTNT